MGRHDKDQTGAKKCTYCEIQRTPKWRKGPMGPKTLCNACGVRYKSGNLYPKYRPAGSPTFVPDMHSNLNKKVLETRIKRKKGCEEDELKIEPESMSNDTHLVDQMARVAHSGQILKDDDRNNPKSTQVDGEGVTSGSTPTNTSCLRRSTREKSLPAKFNQKGQHNHHHRHRQHQSGAKKCTHCEITKTPQWREGPMGPKTLCNACGVRYRSGHLYPEYRPAGSPTFVPELHSNFNRKVIQTRIWKRKSCEDELQIKPEFMSNGTHLVDQMARVARSGRILTDDDSNNTTQVDGEGITSGSAPANKKMRRSSPLSTVKSERIEKHMLDIFPTSRKPQRVENRQMPSTLRRSERDIGEKLKLHISLSRWNGDNAGASGSMEVEHGGHCSENKVEEVRGEDLSKGCERDLEGSSSPLREPAECILRHHREIERPDFNGKCKHCLVEADKTNNRDSSPVSEHEDSSSKSSNHGDVGISEKAVGDAEKMHIDCSAREDLQEPDLFESPSEGASGTPAGNGSQLLPSSTAQTDGVRYLNINDISDIPGTKMVELEDRRKLRESQKNLHILLKPEISKLCGILRLPEDVKEEIERVLEYMVNNHHINKQPETILQAFQISLCWAAASLLKHKICHKETLALAKQHLNFECKKEEAEFVYGALRKMLKKTYFPRAKNVMKSNHGEDPARATNDAEHHFKKRDQSTVSDQHVTKPNHEISKSIKLVRKIHNRRMRNLSAELIEKHDEFLKKSEELVKKAKEKLEEKHKFEYSIVRCIHSHIPVVVEKLKLVDREFQTKLNELNNHVEVEKKKLESMQQAAMDEEKRLKSHWLREAKSGRPVDSFSELPLTYSQFRFEDMDYGEQDGVSDGLEKATSISRPSSEEQITDRTGLLRPVEMLVVEAPITVRHESVEGAIHTELPDFVARLASRCTESEFIHENLVILPSVESQLPPHTDPPSEPLPSNQSTKHDVSVLPPAVQLKLPPPTDPPSDPLPSNQSSNHDVSVVSPAAELQLPLPTDPPSDPLPSNNDVSVVSPAVQLLLPPLTDPGASFLTSSDQLQLPASTDLPCEPLLCNQSNHFNHDISVPQPSAELQLPPTADPHSEHNQPDAPACMEIEHGGGNGEEKNSADQSRVPTQSQVDDQVELVNNSAQQLDTQLEDDIQLRHTTSQQAEVPTQPPPAEDHIELLSHNANSQPDTMCQLPMSMDRPLGVTGNCVSDTRSAGIVPDFSNYPVQTSPLTLMSQPLPHHDPLSNELASLQKEEDHIMKFHEDVKMRISSDFEKEVAEIHQKYNKLRQDADTVLAQKTKALEENFNIILMNKMLAEVFRLKCSDIKAAEPPGLQQGASLGIPQQQLFQQSSQQSAQRPPLVPAAGASTAPSAAAQPLIQQVHHSSSLYSSNNTVVRPHCASNVNYQIGGGELRAPAPHLQPFRPSTSISAAPVHPPSLTGIAISSQQTLSNPAAASFMGPQLVSSYCPAGSPNQNHQSESAELSRNSSNIFDIMMRDFDNGFGGANSPNLSSPVPSFANVYQDVHRRFQNSNHLEYGKHVVDSSAIYIGDETIANESYNSNQSHHNATGGIRENSCLNPSDSRSFPSGYQKSRRQVGRKASVSRKFQYHPMGVLEVNEEPADTRKNFTRSESSSSQQVVSGSKSLEQRYPKFVGSQIPNNSTHVEEVSNSL